MKRKIKITEDQHKMIRENLRESHHMKNINYVDEQADKLYRTIASSTILEVLDGDLDVESKKMNVESLDKVMGKTLNELRKIQNRSTKNMDDVMEFERKALEVKEKVGRLMDILNGLGPVGKINENSVVNKVFADRTAKLKS